MMTLRLTSPKNNFARTLLLSYSRTPGHNVRSLVTNLHQGRFLISAELSRFPNERKTDAGMAVWTH